MVILLQQLTCCSPQETEATGGTQQIYEQVEELASLLSTSKPLIFQFIAIANNISGSSSYPLC